MSSDLLGYEQAASIVAQYAHAIRGYAQQCREKINLASASGRILASPLHADEDQPPFPRSTRDGYACRATEVSSRIALPVVGITHAGEAPAAPLPEKSAWEIMTGAPVPEGADCVVMLEHVERTADTIRLAPSRTIASGENFVARGAQSRRGDHILDSGVSIGSSQIALAASCGYSALEVFCRPRVAILTTGDELVAIDSTPGPGKIRNSNAPMLAALIQKFGADPVVLATAADTAEALDSALAQVVHADMLLISGGVSAGKHDLVEPALARVGAQFYFTGVKIQPGKPLVFGEIPRRPESPTAQVFFGLPGNPISSAATFHFFATPILAALAGSNEIHPRFVLAQLARDTDRKAKPGLTRFLPAHCTFNRSVDALPQVETVPWHGSGDLTAFAQSNCFLVIPEDKSGLGAGSTVRILLH
ncbi:MAG: molybdopterin molybdotransferase MoeA [Acidobacteria bacterium]|nr:molybdopterin molybdotransferase MoeA [Acidobacteriota bacterium]